MSPHIRSWKVSELEVEKDRAGRKAATRRVTRAEDLIDAKQATARQLHTKQWPPCSVALLRRVSLSKSVI